MDKQLANDFLEESSRALDFLVQEYSFSQRQLEVDHKINFAFVTFIETNLAVECILDERDGDIDCKIVRVIGGKKTTHYAVDENGVRVREGLASLLRRRGVRNCLFERVTGLDLRERMKVTLRDFARMLRKHGHAILADSSDALT